MSSCKFIAISLLAFVALPSGAGAQGATSSAVAPAGMRDPGDPRAAVPAVGYTSAFRRYRPNADVEVGAWRDLNDNVGRIGGWRVYGREASPDSLAPAGQGGNAKADGASPSPKPTHGDKH